MRFHTILAVPLILVGCATTSGAPPASALATSACDEAIIAVKVAPQSRLDSLRVALASTHWSNAQSVIADEPLSLINRGEIGAALTRLYPRDLRDAGRGGVANFFVVVDATGAIEHYTPLETTGYASLDRSSAQVLQLMRFSPAIAGGCRAAAAALLPVIWQSHVPR
jgi:outer membrane biosynthesis protein TonB